MGRAFASSSSAFTYLFAYSVVGIGSLALLSLGLDYLIHHLVDSPVTTYLLSGSPETYVLLVAWFLATGAVCHRTMLQNPGTKLAKIVQPVIGDTDAGHETMQPGDAGESVKGAQGRETAR